MGGSSKETRQVRRLRAAVDHGQPDAIVREMSFKIEKARWPSFASRIAAWAIEAGQPACLAVALDERWGPATVDRKVFGFENLMDCLVTHASRHVGSSAFDRVALLDAILAGGGRVEDRTLKEQPVSGAVRNDDRVLVKALLERGASPDGHCIKPASPAGPEHRVWPPLCLATSVPMVSLLLSHGANDALSPPGEEAGGIAAVLRCWPRPEELPEVVRAWLAEGGDPFKPLECLEGPAQSLAQVAFQSPVFLPRPPARVPYVEEARTRFRQIQEALVLNGFDLHQATPEGATWADDVRAHGSPRLALSLSLADQPTPPPPRSIRPRI